MQYNYTVHIYRFRTGCLSQSVYLVEIKIEIFLILGAKIKLEKKMEFFLNIRKIGKNDQISLKNRNDSD